MLDSKNDNPPPVKPILLDIFCGAGGASVGYHRAGFDIVGVDINPQPNYPFNFIQLDYKNLDISWMKRFDAIHSSPPCQAFTTLAKQNKRKYPDYIEDVRWMLKAAGKPYVIENVMRAPLLNPIMLCGTMFEGLRVIRHRLFECNFLVGQPACKPHPQCHHKNKRLKSFGKTNMRDNFLTVTGNNFTLQAGADAMKIDWKMTKREMAESIPPAYTHYIGKFLKKRIATISPPL